MTHCYFQAVFVGNSFLEKFFESTWSRPIASTAVCGDDICEENKGEECRSCWKDCGACKQIVYIYVSRNFTLSELTQNLNTIPGIDVKFKKDIEAINNVSNFFFSKKAIPRYFAYFMDTRYKFLYNSLTIA